MCKIWKYFQEGQVIVCNRRTQETTKIGPDVRNIFVEKSYTKCGRETIPRLFSKASLDQFLYSLFLLYGNLRAIET